MAKNPTKADCNLNDALDRAAKRETELPQVIQVRVSDWDTVVLADEVRRLRALKTAESVNSRKRP